MAGNFFKLILHGLRFRPLRSWLTVLGIVIGIMLVAVILALGNGIQHAVRNTLQMFGSDLVFVFPGKETNPLVGLMAGSHFRTNDLQQLEEIDGVKFVMPVDTAIVTAEYKGETQPVLLHAQNWSDYIEILEQSQGVVIEQGRYPERDDTDEVVLGYATARTLFREPVRIGDEITIKSKRFRIVGSVSRTGEQNHDSVVYISYDLFRLLTGNTGTAYSAVVKVLPGTDLGVVAQQIRFQLEKQSVVGDFSVLTPEKANVLIDNVLGVVELSLMIIALVSLAVGGVGVMNTMYTSVFERTRQIGIMKAVGATREAILMLFLIESGIIGFIGGLFGVILGLLLADGVAMVAGAFGVPGLFTWAGVDYVGAAALLTFTFIIGIVAGFLPARAASRLEPAEALRYE